MSEKVQSDSAHLCLYSVCVTNCSSQGKNSLFKGRNQEQDQLSWHVCELLKGLKIRKTDHSFIKMNGSQTGVGKRLYSVLACRSLGETELG